MSGDEGWIWLVDVNVADSDYKDVTMAERGTLDRSHGGNPYNEGIN
jgi:hypothetical protein